MSARPPRPGGNPEAPAWLADFQARFGAMLRTPLDRSSGTLRATPVQYDRTLRGETLPNARASADERLAVYNRQYWFRLFGLFQSAFPLSSRLIGHWEFNDYVARFIGANAPQGYLIDRAIDGFALFFARSWRSIPGGARRPPHLVPRRALIEAIRIDAAFRGVFYAPQVTPFRPDAAQAATLLESRLALSPAAAIFSEHWPLVELREKHANDEGAPRLALPPALAVPQRWALVRRPGGTAQLKLDPREGELLWLLLRYPIAGALGRLEARCSGAERESLPERARFWLARSVELGFWSGLHSQEMS